MFRPAALSVLLTLAIAACGSASDPMEIVGGLAFLESRPAPFAVAADAPVSVGTHRMAYLADEAASAGSDLNGDGDSLDRVAVAFDLRLRQATPLRAASATWILGEEIWFTTSEDLDGRDWSGDGTREDIVLLHSSSASGAVTFVAEIEGEPVASGERLFFADGGPLPAIPGATKLQWVDRAAPTAPVRVLAAGPEVGSGPRPVAIDEGLLFLHQDEVTEGRDLNGDGDADDGSVLALLDGIDPAAPVRSVGLSHAQGTPVRARRVAGEGWLVAFLVDEAGEGRNLNDAAHSGGSLPAVCAGLVDSDLDDLVLHCLFHGSWSGDPALFPPLDTGLAGRGRVLALESADGARFIVGTTTHEVDEGACSLNDDADQDDRVLRWVEVTRSSVVPRPAPERAVALHDAPGGVHGVVELDERFVAILSESEDGHDLNGDPARDVNPLAFTDPFASSGDPDSWTFRIITRSAEWMGPSAEGRILQVSVEEAELASSCNRDTDFDDSFAYHGHFDPGGLFLSGFCYAAERFNTGQVLIGDVAFWRASERDQNRDINEDRDLDDVVLVRHTVFPLGRLLYNVGTLNDLPLPSVFRGEGDLVAFLMDEAMAGRDANGDGDASDLVLRTVSIH
jgi:hypothetical protein